MIYIQINIKMMQTMKNLQIEYYICKNCVFLQRIAHLDKMINVFENHCKEIQFDKCFHNNDIADVTDLIQTGT